VIILAIQLINNVNIDAKGDNLDESAIRADMIQRFSCYSLTNV